MHEKIYKHDSTFTSDGQTEKTKADFGQLTHDVMCVPSGYGIVCLAGCTVV